MRGDRAGPREPDLLAVRGGWFKEDYDNYSRNFIGGTNAVLYVDPNEKLVRMANQIAAFFRSYPQDEAVAGIHKHVTAFWTPRMREQLAAYFSVKHLGSVFVVAEKKWQI